MDKTPAFIARSVLFVPADRPDRYAKALDSGADLVCVDLEDAIARENKAKARGAVAGFFKTTQKSDARRALRINSLSTLDGLKDVLHLATQHIRPDIILLPKTTCASEVRSLDLLLNEIGLDCPIIAIIETAEGLDNASEIAMSPRVVAICFGSADYSAEAGSGMQWDALHYARGRIVQAAARAGVLALDGAWLAIADMEGLAVESSRLPGIGFDGRVVIHPAQIATVHKAFQPAATDIERAGQIMLAVQSQGGSVIAVDGRMVDRPVILWAQRILACASRGTSHGIG